MVTAICLAKVEPQRVSEAAEEVSRIEGVSAVYSVGGQYDLVVVLRARDSEGLVDAVTRRILKTQGILDTETMIASRVHASEDLERMFSIGLDESAE